jgi:hypothetical protein
LPTTLLEVGVAMEVTRDEAHTAADAIAAIGAATTAASDGDEMVLLQD